MDFIMEEKVEDSWGWSSGRAGQGRARQRSVWVPEPERAEAFPGPDSPSPPPRAGDQGREQGHARLVSARAVPPLRACVRVHVPSPGESPSCPVLAIEAKASAARSSSRCPGRVGDPWASPASDVTKVFCFLFGMKRMSGSGWEQRWGGRLTGAPSLPLVL